MPPIPPLEHAARWRALLVGIDHYAKGERKLVSDLKRPVPDVVRAARWLIGAGVPADRITVLASSSKANRPLLKQLNEDMQAHAVKWASKSATLTALYDTLSRLRSEPKTADDRLLVIMSGHGLYLPADGGRILLTQEYDGENNLTNISLAYMQRLLADAGYREVLIVYAACANSAYQIQHAATIKPGWPAGRVPPFDPIHPAPMFTFHASRVMEFASEIDNKNLFLDSILGCLEASPSSLRDFDPVRGVEALNVERLVAFVQTAVKVRGFEPWPEWNQTPERVKHLCAWPVPTATLTVEVNPDAVRGSIDYVRVEQVKPYPQDWRIAPSADAAYVTQVQQGSTLRTDVPLTIDATGWRPIRHADQFVMASTPYVSSLTFNPLEGGGTGTQPVYELSATSPDGQGMDILTSIKEKLAIDRLVEDAASPLVAGISRGSVLELQFRPDGHAAFKAATLLWREATEFTAQEHPHATVRLGHVDANAPTGLLVQAPERGWGTLLGAGWTGAELNSWARESQPLHHKAVLTVSRAGDPEPVKAVPSYELRERGDGMRLLMAPGVYDVKITLPWGHWLQTVSVPPGVITPVQLPESVGDLPLRYRLVNRPDEHQDAPWIMWLGRPPGAMWSWDDRPSRIQPVTLNEGRPTPVGLKGDVTEVTLQVGRWFYSFPVAPKRGYLVAADRFGRQIRVEPYSELEDVGWDTLVALGHLEDPAALTPDVLSTLLYAKGVDGLLGLAGGYALQLGSHGSYEDRLLVTTNLITAQPGIDAELLYIAARLNGVQESSKPSLFPNRFPDPTGWAWDRQFSLLERMWRGEIPLFRWGVDLALVIASHPELKGLVPLPWKRRLIVISRRLIRDNVWTLWRVGPPGQMRRPARAQP